MKKIIITLILLILFPVTVLAKDVGANLQGITIYRPGQGQNTSSGGGGSCGTNPFWFSQNTPLEGLRITFYSQSGKQIGTTVDIWNADITGSKKTIDDRSDIGFKGYAINYSEFGYYYVYENKKTGEVNYKPTRIDFLDAGLKNDGKNYELVRYYLGYKVYVDEVAMKITCPGIKTQNKNPFTYTEDSAKCLTNYFTTKEEKNGVKSFPVMERYLKLTGADKYASITEGNYVMTLEPIIKINQCGGNKGEYVSITTTSEWGMINKKDCEKSKAFDTFCTSEYKAYVSSPTKKNGDNLQKCMTNTNSTKWNAYRKVNQPYLFNGSDNVGNTVWICGVGNNILRQTFFNHLSLGSNQYIGSYSFRGVKSTDPRHILSPQYYLNFMDMLWLDGFGIGAINGTDLCEPNCGAKTHQIVYRIIDLDNPFLGVNGKKRELSIYSNWYNKESTIDKKIYSKKPLYTVTLTPVTVKKIRKDNQTVDYTKIIEKYKATDTFAKSAFKKKFGL